MKKHTGTIKLLVGGFVAALVLSTTAAFASDVQYERHGRFMKRVVSLEKSAPLAQARVAVADQKTEGQFTRQGRFMKRNGLGGQRGIVKREVAGSSIRHEHGVNSKGHRNVRY